MYRKISRLLRAAVVIALPLLLLSANAQAYLQGAPGAPRLVAPGEPVDYLTTPNWAYTPPIRKFVDTLPLLGTPNNLGQYLPVAVPDQATYPGSDYYIIKLVQFETKMHTDLPPTTLRGYVQMAETGLKPTDPGYIASLVQMGNPQYLGPVIVAQKDRPVRVLFINGLTAGGELFVPVDQTIMGSGDYEIDFDPITKEPLGTSRVGKFSQNRAELHLHGGRSPWISDGTPHQWITPAGDDPDYPQGVSVVNVPDMPDPGAGAQTYYWTNQQSARLMFYHDHAWGITRLNVYVGEAAGYVIEDPVEQALVGTVLPVDMIPLVVQDKTFVDATPAPNPYGGADVPKILLTDPTWRWGTGAVTGSITEFGQTVDVRAPKTGDLWWPHVYMPAQNPFDITGIAPMGRWAFGPYFWPATNNPYQPIANPYWNPACNTSDPTQNEADTFGYTTISGVPFCQPPEVPATPNPSWGAEAFMDTPTVNGTAYPILDVEPKAYRFRILNAAHDRFFNLQLYEVDNSVMAPLDHCTGVDPQVPCDRFTEVKMLPATFYPSAPATWPADGRDGGVPDWTKTGPEWVMYASEGGFLPQPVVIPHHPVTWNGDVTTFNAGNVNGGSLILGPAERADVVVDFSLKPGKTYILYNDAPAPWPALDPHYDYFTGAQDMTDAGGLPGSLPGLGPNTRTIMKIRVAASSPDTGNFSLAALQAAFDTAPGTPSVFEAGQDPLIAGQGNMNPTGDPALYEAFLFDTPYDAINNTYNSFFPTSWPNWGVARINDKAIHFIGVDGSTTYQYNPLDTSVHPLDGGTPLYGGIPMHFKAIQDEQGETFDEYGRMRAGLGLELINPGANVVNFIVQTYSDPATEVLEENGIQVWKITHNGVDTHPVHFHLYDVQVLNRVGWDGFIRLPDPTELGWKDTVRISPLEDTIVALKPVTPRLPFGVPESIRPLNPARPAFTTTEQTELTQIDPYTGEARNNYNRLENLDWEYVWHCHILSHEENDMMRPQSFLFNENLPGDPALIATAVSDTQIDLTWTDSTVVDYLDPLTYGGGASEIGYVVERSANGGAFEIIAKPFPNTTAFSDTTVAGGTTYDYKVTAYNAEGATVSAANIATVGVTVNSPAPGLNTTVGFPVTITAGSAPSITSMEFYDGTTLLGTDPDGTAPFEFSWTPMTVGTHNISVKGFDNLAQTYVSGQVAVNVTAPVLGTPVNGATLAGSSQLFTWSANPAATLYQLYVGKTQGANDLGRWPATAANVTSVTVPNLPVNGSTIYVRFYSQVAGSWFFIDYTYTAATPPTAVTMISPVNAATLSGSSQLFSWNAGTANAYQLYVGTTGAGSQNLGRWPAAPTTSTSVTVPNLPINGSTVYVRLWSRFGTTTWLYNDYTYTAFTPNPAFMLTPVNGSTLTAASQTFTWDPAAGDLFQLYVGTAQGGQDLGRWPPAATTATSVLVPILPTNGSTVYVRLYSRINGAWFFQDYSYTAVTQ